MKYQVKKNLGVTLRQGSAEFRVWAPFAKSVHVAIPYIPFHTEGKIAMNPEKNGYWSVSVSDIEPGQNYKYVIETANGDWVERNDPRARALTDSDQGSSIIVDNYFDWGDDMFMPIPKEHQVIYEMHIGTFNRPDAATPGTFRDAIEKLDYLRDLGITTVELMPVTSMTSNSNGWGYAPNQIFSVESSYGGRHGLMEFVRQAHLRGLGVVLDLVYNHFALTDLWQYDGWSASPDTGGIYFYNDRRGNTPWGTRPDYGRSEVRQFLLDNVVMWFNEFRLDGLRLDSTAYMRNIEGHNDDPANDIGEAWRLLQDMTSLAHHVRPGSLMIAEDTSVNEYITKPVSQGGCGFDAQWGLNFSHAVRTQLGLPAPFPTSLESELPKKYNGESFQKIIFSDSHDTAANGNERLNEQMTPDDPVSVWARRRSLLACTTTMTSTGIPMLLQGQEFMQDGDFNNWRELEWSKAEQFAGIVDAHRDLIDLRLNIEGHTSGLVGNNVNVFHNNVANNVLAYHRWNDGGIDDDVIVVLNFSANDFPEYSFVLPLAGDWKVRFNSSFRGYSDEFPDTGLDIVQTNSTNAVTIPLAPYGAYVLSRIK
ncbi:1,4-alpha-glucan branching protein [Candidatus Saccharibacteria bacterium]|nr:1,4-alpha-glucan branching protein [Candidatus Saccharibacteria bacterium]NCU40650.1 1,4-alpha-glucan branching protein [Candidatus Saccharibacteria bacterium]